MAGTKRIQLDARLADEAVRVLGVRSRAEAVRIALRAIVVPKQPIEKTPKR